MNGELVQQSGHHRTPVGECLSVPQCAKRPTTRIVGLDRTDESRKKGINAGKYAENFTTTTLALLHSAALRQNFFAESCCA